jgi:hypothetical protein
MERDRGKAKAQSKKPRGEELLDRLDKNPRDQKAWDELAGGARKPGQKQRKRSKKRKTKKRRR